MKGNWIDYFCDLFLSVIIRIYSAIRVPVALKKTDVYYYFNCSPEYLIPASPEYLLRQS